MRADARAGLSGVRRIRVRMSMVVSSATMMIAVRPFAESLQVEIIGVFEMVVDMMMFRIEAVECI